ncbi:MAG TPA: YihY/virulence factor BrkB family protein [Acidimicrobiales bacterium]|nr:YihY/virulence factor BrkB family protein [Acidimicrobiales bacterium]
MESSGGARIGQPVGPTDLPKPSLVAVLKRSRVEFRNDNLTTLAAALTYYGVLAMVPGLIVLFAVLALLGKHATDRIVAQVDAVAPGSTGHFVHTLLVQAQTHKTGSGITAVVGVLIALWSASSYVNGFRQASNVIYGIGEGRPAWKTVSLRVAITVLAVVVLVACAAIVVVSGSVADEVGNAIGAGHAAVDAWNIAKWPVLLVLLSVLLAVLFWASPNAKVGGIRWVSPGGLLATALWLVFSALFAVYVTELSSYNRTYGPLAGIVVFLVWLWLSNVALLLGAEVNAELDHAKAIAEGLPDDVRPFAEPRDTRKLDEHDKRAVAEAEARRPG